MKEKIIKQFAFIFCSLLILCQTVIADTDAYTRTLSVFQQSPVVSKFFSNSYGYAVFPTIGKLGFVVGAAHGKGLLYKGGIPSANVLINKVTLGLQLGGQAFSEIIFFQDKRAYQEFIKTGFEFDADLSAVVITAGVQASAGSDGATASASAGPATGVQAKAQYFKGMAVFVHTKGGLMYEASVGGQKFTVTPL